MAGPFGQLDALIDGCVGGNAIEKAQLKRAHAESDRDLRIEFFSGFGEEFQLVIEEDLPAEHAEHESCGQMAVGGRERVDGSRAQQIIRVRVAALDSQQDFEGGFTCGRDGGQGGQPRRASAWSGFPRRNSSVVMRFLPSI